MTEINRANYQQLIPEIKEKIKTASFICFDAEFSGLGQPPGETKTSLFDTGAERYAKMRKTALQNTSPQIGLCIFRKDKDESKNLFHVEAYQAYITEPSFGGFNNENKTVLSLEYKCAKFLRKYNFDFNAFQEGSVPCLNKTKVQELKKYLDENPGFMQNGNRYFDKAFFPEVKPMYTEEDKSDLIRRLRGLSEIVDVITEFKIPLVGHNVGLDLLYFFRMFCTELPESYSEFKELAIQFLENIYDTKFMILTCKKILNSHPAFKNNDDKSKLQSSSLYTAFQQTSTVEDKLAPRIKLGTTCDYFDQSMELGRQVDLEVDKNNLVHSPAFDACVTGSLFLNVAHIAARIDKNFKNRFVPPTLSELFCNVQAWKDQIFVSRASVNAMYLRGNDPKPNRPRWTEVRSDERIVLSTFKMNLSVHGPVDVDQIDEKTVRFAAAGGKSAKDMKKFLTEKGYICKNVTIPYNKPSYAVTGRLQMDNVYDRSKPLG